MRHRAAAGLPAAAACPAMAAGRGQRVGPVPLV